MTEPIEISTLRRTLRRNRENLHFEVIAVRDDEQKRERVARLIHDTEGAGIVYTSTVKDCEAVTEHLEGLGLSVARYHGKLGARERKRNQDRFMAGEIRVIVATNAFGMGIDKPDIRFVVHYNLPGSLESYYQEAGRAGGDGEPARCALLYLAEDRNTQIFFLNGRYPQEEHFDAVYKALEKLRAAREPVTPEALHERAGVAQGKVRVVLAMMKDLEVVAEPEPGQFRLLRTGLSAAELDTMAKQYEQRAEVDRDRLRSMVLYAQTALCRWKAILDYFGEEVDWDRCGRCDSCEHPVPEPGASHAESPNRAIPRSSDVLTLPPLLGGGDPASVQAGDTVTLPIFGIGEVRTADAKSLVLVFGDGETREFRRP